MKKPNLYEKLLLLALMVMTVVFAVLYPVTIFREGYLYNDKILVPGMENGNTTYSARVKGEQWCFTVTADQTVTFRCGEKLYGPYTVKEDPSAIPEGDDLAGVMTGVEVRCGDELLFRVGIYDMGGYWLMTNEDGTPTNPIVSISAANGTRVDADGNPYDPMKPTVGTLLEMVRGPELTHKGRGVFFFVGLGAALTAACNILFADELLRWRHRFSVRNPEKLEPSDITIGMRPLVWTLMVIVVLVAYIWGLQIVF